MAKVKFIEHGLTGTKSGVCPTCWKKATRTARFSQTLNPFNKNLRGEVKTVGEIMEENKRRVKQWEGEPVYHARCESG